MNPGNNNAITETARLELKPIHICADDFGMSPEINAGILGLANDGSLSAVSCMSRGKVFQRDAESLAVLPIEKGLHLNLTESMDENVFVQPVSRLIFNCFSRRVNPEPIKFEIEHQLDLFEQSFGCAPDYVDGHQHVHQFPIVRECLIEILLRRYRNRRPWLRSTRRPKQQGVPAGIRMKAAVIEYLGGHSMQALAKRGEFKMNVHLLGVYGFGGGEQGYAKLLDAWIEATGPNDLIMCHPAHGVDATDPIGIQRCAEYSVLSGPALRSLLEQHKAFVGKLS